ncbi:hypothetical protein CCACVL1_16735 [Corchorus capsularis]|uniref:Uncharacterized protein n=1 Tax=Corchorus capsularis TaxID=210143 RepID=A0A1R3HVV7_COCAP|nr:hypothetical protein CCACVL1_16735 [Corchorus capsularis]
MDDSSLLPRITAPRQWWNGTSAAGHGRHSTFMLKEGL